MLPSGLSSKKKHIYLETMYFFLFQCTNPQAIIIPRLIKGLLVGGCERGGSRLSHNIFPLPWREGIKGRGNK